MGLSPHCVLLLFASTLTVGLDFRHEPKPLGQSVFVRRSNTDSKAAGIVKRSLPAWLAASADHKITRRSGGQGDSCKAVEGHNKELAGNTHSVSYQPSSSYASHARQVNDDAQVLNRCANGPSEPLCGPREPMRCFPFPQYLKLCFNPLFKLIWVVSTL